MKKKPKSQKIIITLRHKFTVASIFAALATLIVFTIDAYHLLPKAPDQFIYDWKVSLLSTRIKEQRKDISLIYVDDKSLSGYFYNSPIDRGLLAELVRAVDAAKPKVIGLDIIFDRFSEPDRDDALISALGNATAPIVMIATDKEERGVSDEGLAWQADFLTRANKIVSSPFLDTEDTSFLLGDDVIRSMEPFDQTSAKHEPFAFALARYAGISNYPAARTIDWLLMSPDGAEPFQTFIIPAHRRVSGASDGEAVLPTFMKEFLKDKIVIIGANTNGLDRHRVPMTVATNAYMPGAHIQAQILAQIIDNRSVSKLPIWLEVVLIFAVAFSLFFIVVHYDGHHPKMLIEAALVTCVVAFGILMFWSARIIFPGSSLIMVWLLVGIFGEIGAKMIRRMVALRNSYGR